MQANLGRAVDTGEHAGSSGLRSTPQVDVDDAAAYGDYLDDDEVGPRATFASPLLSGASGAGAITVSATTFAVGSTMDALVDLPGGAAGSAAFSSGSGGAVGRSISAMPRRRPASMAVFTTRRVAGNLAAGDQDGSDGTE